MRRRWNIDDAGWLHPHDHVAWFGDGDDELYAVAGAALADGARRNEKLVFVEVDPDPNRLLGLDQLERLLATGQLELLATDEVYGAGGAFSAGDPLTRFDEVLSGALRDGYAGLRVVADNTPLVRGDDQGFRRWLAWEQLTDRFQAAAPVTGICFFDARALSEARRVDLAALHPVRSAGGDEPPFCLFSDGGAAFVTGTLNASSAARLQRILDALPARAPLVIDLSCANVEDHDPLLAITGVAGPDRPVRLRGDAQLVDLMCELRLTTEHVTVQFSGCTVRRCTRCGDAIGVYEPIVVLAGGRCWATSLAAEPQAAAAADACYHRDCEIEPQ